MRNIELLDSFGERVKKLRNDAGWSQEEFARYCRFHRTYISFIERGKRNIGLENIYTIARVF